MARKRTGGDLVVVMTLTLRKRTSDGKWIAHATDKLNDKTSIYSKPRSSIRKALNNLGVQIEKLQEDV